MFHKESLHLYHLHGVPALNEADFHQCVPFACWFFQQCLLHSQFPASVLFKDEATFPCDGIFNMYSSHVWATVNSGCEWCHLNPNGVSPPQLVIKKNMKIHRLKGTLLYISFLTFSNIVEQCL